MDREMFRRLKTTNWHTRDYFDLPASCVNFVYVNRETPEPEEASVIRQGVWDRKLREMKAVLETSTGNAYDIRHDEETE